MPLDLLRAVAEKPAVQFALGWMVDEDKVLSDCFEQW